MFRVIPRLHLVTDDGILSEPGFIGVARALLERGGPGVALHLRGPGMTGRAVFQVAQALRDDALRSGSLLLVNDRLDICLSLDLRGAHLGQRSLPPGAARSLLGSDRILGLSVHSRAEGEGAGGGTVDFFLVGTLFSTTSHPGREPAGTDILRDLTGPGTPPLVGIGGITPRRVGDVIAGGAHGVAVRGGVWGAPDPVEALGVYLSEMARSVPVAGRREERPGGDSGVEPGMKKRRGT